MMRVPWRHAVLGVDVREPLVQQALFWCAWDKKWRVRRVLYRRDIQSKPGLAGL
jgi:hypothetical protein